MESMRFGIAAGAAAIIIGGVFYYAKNRKLKSTENGKDSQTLETSQDQNTKPLCESTEVEATAQEQQEKEET